MPITNTDLQEFIRREIWQAASQQLKREREAAQAKPRPDASPDWTNKDREFDNLLFNGGYEDRGFHKTIGLSESVNEIPPISSQEVSDFEKKFGDILSKYTNATTSFDEQGKQRKSMQFKKTDKGIAVQASGYIQVGNEGTIRWMFSIPNGFRIETEGLEVTQSNRDLIADLYNFYNEWQKEWRQKLLGNYEQEEMNPEDDGFDTAGEVPGGVEMAPPGEGGDTSMAGDLGMAAPGGAAGGQGAAL